MKKNYIEPEGVVENHNFIISDKYLVKRYSGNYNYGRITWHVFKMEWIVGELEFSELENAMALLSSKENDNKFMGAEIEGIAYYGKVIETIGEMSKREARKLLNRTSHSEEQK